MKDATLAQVLEARAGRTPLAVVTRVSDGTQGVVTPDTADALLPPEAVADATRRLAADESGTVVAGGETWFVHAHTPPYRMVVVGAVHIAQPLVKMGVLAGFDTIVIDPRSAFATAERFPGVRVVDLWPDEAMSALGPDSRTAVITLTHDPKLDDAALSVALRSPAFFIGSLGSTRTHAARCKRLRREGFSDSEIARIHGPVGLAIGARAPAEIAAAILAQVVSVRRGGSVTG
ncbi:MAG: XdhC family protein [Alphaproteobacteria bacterium]|nr:XdhC family protein [Alphaproteobacteria bacterium]